MTTRHMKVGLGDHAEADPESMALAAQLIEMVIMAEPGPGAAINALCSILVTAVANLPAKNWAAMLEKTKHDSPSPMEMQVLTVELMDVLEKMRDYCKRKAWAK